ncbi:F-box protein PP2-A13-like isoform X2 [Carex rostrata]
MGAGISCLEGDGPQCQRGTMLGDIPEDCVAQMLLQLDPPEICQLAGLSRTFRLATSADPLWEAKLPCNYRYLIDKTCQSDVEGGYEEWAPLTKKEIFARLCRPNPFDGGTKEFWLEKRRGGICSSISSRALSITGIDDRRYWNCIPTDESRLHLGRPSKRLGLRKCIMDHVHGWNIKPVQFELSTSDGQCAQSRCYLDGPGVWKIYHVGDFVVKDSSTPVIVNFSMTQIDCTHTKGGLCVDTVFVQPKGLFKQHKCSHDTVT